MTKQLQLYGPGFLAIGRGAPPCWGPSDRLKMEVTEEYPEVLDYVFTNGQASTLTLWGLPRVRRLIDVSLSVSQYETGRVRRAVLLFAADEVVNCSNVRPPASHDMGGDQA